MHLYVGRGLTGIDYNPLEKRFLPFKLDSFALRNNVQHPTSTSIMAAAIQYNLLCKGNRKFLRQRSIRVRLGTACNMPRPCCSGRTTGSRTDAERTR